jgi:N-acetylated-alpha-linked acidic dipeptidase
MRPISAALLSSAILFSGWLTRSIANAAASSSPATTIFGFRDAAAETATESRFLAVPDAKLAEEHLRILTQAPHMAGTV